MNSRLFIASSFALLLSTFAYAQTTQLPGSFPQPDFGGLPDDGGDFRNFGNEFGGTQKPNISVEAEYQIHPESNTGLITVSVEISDPWYIYAMTQGEPSIPTSISVTGVELLADFQPVQPAKVFAKFSEKGPPDFIQKHTGKVQFVAPFKAAETPDSITVTFGHQLCTSLTCQAPAKTELQASLLAQQLAKPVTGAPELASGIRLPQSRARVDGFIAPSKIQPGKTAYLILQTVADPDWYVYAMEQTGNSLPVRIVFDKLPAGLSVGEFQPQKKPKKKKPFADQPEILAHPGAMSWRIPVEVAKNVEAGSYEVSGTFGYQACTTGLCQQPLGVSFRGVIEVGDAD